MGGCEICRVGVQEPDRVRENVSAPMSCAAAAAADRSVNPSADLFTGQLDSGCSVRSIG